MRNIKLIIEYDGTEFFGWQTQKIRTKNSIRNTPYAIPATKALAGRRNTRTIQETIESALRNILQEKVKLIGSGRTDSGVHALGQVANFKTKSELSVSDIKRALNAVLPPDIAIKEAKEAAINFHSRFDAKSKIYRYTLLNSQTRKVAQRNLYFFYPYKLNLTAMRSATKFLKGKKDFKSFQSSDKKQRSSKRTIKSLFIKREEDFIHFEIEADGFLYKMVRAIVGTLLEVGSGKLKPQEISGILSRKNRKFSGPTVSAKGLTLVKVIY